MYVGIDEAGKHQLAGGIDDFNSGGRFQIPANTRYSFVFNENIGTRAGAHGYDLAIAD